MRDVIVIGSGLNGLVAGALFAKQKLSTLILEQRPTVGGAAVTAEIAPGYSAPRLSHALGPVRREVVRALRLDRAGLEFITPDPALTTLGLDGRTIAFHPDPVITAAAINSASARDAARWQDFLQTAQRIGRIAAALNQNIAPAIDDWTTRERWNLLRVARQAHKLGSQDLARLVRWLPMPVADLVSEWFELDLLNAAISAHAIFGNFAGPRSGGTGGMLIRHLADDPTPVGSGVTVRGGLGALTAAVASIAGKFGADIRTNARVVRVVSRSHKVSGIVTDNGDEIGARVVVSAVDPRQTFLNLVEPEELTPTFLERVSNFRARGVTAKVNLALSAVPKFPALHGDTVPLRGRFLVAPTTEYLERAFDAAKYGELSSDPWLELSIPSVLDPSLAPDSCHVMSIYAHFAPRKLRGAAWPDRRDELYKAVIRALTPHTPNLETLVVNREVLTPEDLERVWGLSGGHIFHGESTLDQTWLARPFLGWARYRTPIDGLYLAGAGTHPGGGLTGGSGLLAATTIIRDLRKKR